MAQVTLGDLLDFLDFLDGQGIIVTDKDLVMDALDVSDVDDLVTIGE